MSALENERAHQAAVAAELSAPKRVLVEVTHQVWVDVVETGQQNTPIDVSKAEAELLVRVALSRMDFGGYSMLGKALRNLNPWKATEMKVVREELPTMEDLLLNKSAAGTREK